MNCPNNYVDIANSIVEVEDVTSKVNKGHKNFLPFELKLASNQPQNKFF